MVKVLQASLHSLDQRFLAEARTTNDSSGTTAVLAVLDDGHLMVANVGDSVVRMLFAPSPGSTKGHMHHFKWCLHRSSAGKRHVV